MEEEIGSDAYQHKLIIEMSPRWYWKMLTTHELRPKSFGNMSMMIQFKSGEMKWLVRALLLSLVWQIGSSQLDDESESRSGYYGFSTIAPDVMEDLLKTMIVILMDFCGKGSVTHHMRAQACSECSLNNPEFYRVMRDWSSWGASLNWTEDGLEYMRRNQADNAMVYDCICNREFLNNACEPDQIASFQACFNKALLSLSDSSFWLGVGVRNQMAIREKARYHMTQVLVHFLLCLEKLGIKMAEKMDQGPLPRPIF